MRSGVPALLSLVTTLVVSSPARAQFLPEQVAPVVRSQDSPPTDRDFWKDGGGAGIGAVVGGAVGLFAVGYAAFYLGGGDRIVGDDPAGLWYGLMGAMVGEAVGIGLGAHLGNGRRGSALASVGASLGVLLLAGVVAEYTDLPGPFVLFVPMAQIAAAVIAEVEVSETRAGRKRR
jgi:hypothetical protein